MTGKERIQRILERKPVDRIGIFEHFWDNTLKHWRQQNLLGQNEEPEDHFNFDIRRSWVMNLIADIDKAEDILEETETTKLVRDGNGALLKYWKDGTGTPEHVDFEVKDRQAWLDKIKPKLLDEDNLKKRINFEDYHKMRKHANDNDLYFVWGGVNVFEAIHPVCGHEFFLMGMGLDPEWVVDMTQTYSDLIIKLQEILFEAEGWPDGIWYYEDMGFKGKPFMSPQMYKDIVFPAHKKTFDFAHANDMKVIVHSCGYVEPLIPAMIEAGMDCLQALEVKAGMDLIEIKKKFGDQIVLSGGLDIRILEENDKDKLEKYLEEMIPPAMKDSGFILHTDHSISQAVEYDTYKFFIDKGLEIGTY